MSAEMRRFRSTRTLGVALLGGLALNVVLAGVMAILRISEIGLLHRIARGELVSIAEVNRSDDRVGAVAIAQILLLLVTGIVWVVWQHRSQSNLHAVGLRELTYTPGWAAGWWFVPFVNFVKPFQTVRELWKASDGGEQWWRMGTTPIIGWWWAAWIAAAILDRAAAYSFNVGEPTVDGLITGSRLFVAGEAALFVAGALAISIVRAVNERQSRLVQVVADRVAVPIRPDVVDEGQGPNP
jgi:Domain of unknown function (DUF4328)